jgi:methanethiol S-methyltransferase
MYRYVSQSNYRLLFNLTSLLLLGAIFWAYSRIDHSILFTFKGQNLIGWVVVIFGATLSYIAFKSYNTAEFFGLVKESSDPQLAVKGMNRYVRHPLYLASFMMLWGALLLVPTQAYLGFAALLTLYIIVGTKLEENKLIEIFGQDYIDYKKRVPMFFPWR